MKKVYQVVVGFEIISEKSASEVQSSVQSSEHLILNFLESIGFDAAYLDVREVKE